jgi:hypothetical protein
MLHDMLRGMRSRPIVALLLALLLAAGPTLGALSSAQAANPHTAMAMSDSGADDGCCDHSDTDTGNACLAHCAAGAIDTSIAFMTAHAVTSSAVPAPVQPSASRAPAPDKQPPKSSAV